MTSSVTSYSNIVCYGNNTGSASVSAAAGSGSYTYQWNDANNQTTATATNLIAGTYTCIVTDAMCNNSVTSTVTIAQPKVISIDSIIVTSGNKITVYPSGGIPIGDQPSYTYSWTPGGETTAILNNAAPDAYTVCVTSNYSCGTICSTVQVNNTTGIDSKAISDNVQIYPTPTDGNFTINLGTNRYQSIKIYDGLGREVYTLPSEGVTNTNEIIINLNNQDIKNGMYLIQLVNSNAVLTKKLLIQK